MTLPANGSAPLNSPSHYAEHVRVVNLATHPSALVTRSTTQNMGTGAWASPTWLTEVRDTHNIWDAGTPGRFYIPAGYAGLWLFTATMDFQGNATGRRGLRFIVNATGQSYGVHLISSVVATTFSMSTTGLVPVAEGDYVEAHAWQDSGITLTIGGGNSMFAGALMSLL